MTIFLLWKLLIMNYNDNPNEEEIFVRIHLKIIQLHYAHWQIFLERTI